MLIKLDRFVTSPEVRVGIHLLDYELRQNMPWLLDPDLEGGGHFLGWELRIKPFHEWIEFLNNGSHGPVLEYYQLPDFGPWI